MAVVLLQGGRRVRAAVQVVRFEDELSDWTRSSGGGYSERPPELFEAALRDSVSRFRRRARERTVRVRFGKRERDAREQARDRSQSVRAVKVQGRHQVCSQLERLRITA